MSAASDRLRDKLRIYNPYGVVEYAAKLGVGPNIWINYRSATRGRGYHSAAWQVIRTGDKTDPNGPWYNNGHKTFNVYARKYRTPQLEAAKAWAAQQYGIAEWATIPGLPGAWFPKTVADLVKAHVLNAPSYAEMQVTTQHPVSSSGLDPQRVSEIFLDCLFRDGEDPSTCTTAEGIMSTVGFHPGRLHAHTPEIESLLGELPDEFMESKGGGWSFLNACMDKRGHLWTGMHQTMDQLFMLGIAAGKAAYALPREMWSALPGEMPYLIVKGQ